MLTGCFEEYIAFDRAGMLLTVPIAWHPDRFTDNLDRLHPPVPWSSVLRMPELEGPPLLLLYLCRSSVTLPSYTFG